jgi:hypothetical protein
MDKQKWQIGSQRFDEFAGWSEEDYNEYYNKSDKHPDFQVARMVKIPPCDFCKDKGVTKPSEYDAKTTLRGSWAWMCANHWVEHRVTDELGLGLGQKIEQEEIK